MAIPSLAGDSSNSTCIECGAAISSKAKFCEECGTQQTAPPLPSTTATGKLNSAEAESAIERSLGAKRFAIFFAIAAVAVALTCVAWFHDHPVSAKAEYEIGEEYLAGKGVQQDDSKAVLWFRKAAEQGYADAEFQLGAMYENGRGGLAKDDAQAFKWLQKAAEQGNANAQSTLGFMYVSGTGVQQNETQAVFWYQKAAEQGEVEAENNLGLIYHSGEGGLLRDESRAVYWWEKAAEQGYAEAQSNLGTAYSSGSGIQRDYAKGFYWYEKAAEQGDANGELNLGVDYELGQGIARDESQAIEWYKKAAAQGDDDAKVPLDRLLAKQQDEQEKRQEAEERIDGTSLSFDDFYVKLHTGFSVGVRYNVFTRISIASGFCFSNPSSDNELDHMYCAGADAAFDDASQYEALLKGPRWQERTVVFSEGYDGRLLIHAAK